MTTNSVKEIPKGIRAIVIPFVQDGEAGEKIPEEWRGQVKTLLGASDFHGKCGEIYAADVMRDDQVILFVFVGLGNPEKVTNREVFLAFGKAFTRCKREKAAHVAVLLDHAAGITGKREICQKICELPYLVSYQFEAYKSSPKGPVMGEVTFVTKQEGFEMILREGALCGESAAIARDLINHPSMYMTPARLCAEAVKIGKECGVEVKIYKKSQIESMGMHAFLAVGRGAQDKPRLIVMRYRGGEPEEAPIALVGKGIMFDSGGYNIKTRMLTMHGDMGGAAAVIGAVRAAAIRKLPINVVTVVAACKNMISGDAYVPGDVLFSMNGKTIEMVNADAEGRLTLADAVTYAIRKEGAGKIIDIATLTGAARSAVGIRTAPVISNDDELFDKVWEASKNACEKVWRLDADRELLPALKSHVADIKNTDPGSPLGGGSIVAGLFIQEFVEDRPWVHVDMATVNWLESEMPYSPRGGTGYGVSLLYETLKLLAGATCKSSRKNDSSEKES